MTNIKKIAVVFAGFVLAMPVFFQCNAECKIVEEHIFLVPAGNIDKRIVENIKNSLPDVLPMTVGIDIDRTEEMPAAAYDTARKQYNAEAVLDDILRRKTIDVRVERVLVITDADLYTKDLNFVFGLANAKKGIAIISTARLKNEFYGLKGDDKLFLRRAQKEAAHELGHTWGLEHCQDKKCVMYFSDDLKDSDNKKAKFCHECHNKIRNRYYSPLYKSPASK